MVDDPMGAAVLDGDIAHLRTIYPTLTFKAPSPQEERALLAYMRGMTAYAAAHSAGYTQPGPFLRFLEKDDTKALMEHIRERHFHDVRMTRDVITGMFLEAYHRAATSMEMVAATRELGKLHGLYLDAKPSVSVNVNTNGGATTIEVNLKKLERMSDEALLELAPNMIALLEAPVPIQRGTPEADDAEVIEHE